jgi:hypothetical protein
MRIIHGDGYSEEEKKKFAKLVYQNVFTAVKMLVQGQKIMGIPYVNPKCDVSL